MLNNNIFVNCSDWVYDHDGRQTTSAPAVEHVPTYSMTSQFNRRGRLTTVTHET